MRTDAKILDPKALIRKIGSVREGKRVVIATGTFDIFHAGHLLFLDFAKRQGDILIVGVGSDRIVKMYKGDERPILHQDFRTRLIAGLEVVDYVVVLDEDPIDKITGRKLFSELKPDIWVVPYKDHNPAGVARFAKEIGARLVRNPRIVPGRIEIPLSTTYIISKLKKG